MANAAASPHLADFAHGPSTAVDGGLHLREIRRPMVIRDERSDCDAEQNLAGVVEHLRRRDARGDEQGGVDGKDPSYARVSAHFWVR
jgi:hypothetical protein